MDPGWDTVLEEALSKFSAARNAQEYHLAVAEMVSVNRKPRQNCCGRCTGPAATRTRDPRPLNPEICWEARSFFVAWLLGAGRNMRPSDRVGASKERDESMANRQQPWAARGYAGARFSVALMSCLAILSGLTYGYLVAADQKTGIGGNGNNPYAIGLWGDLPYSSQQATVGIPNLIADMNSQNLSFTVHDGDLKSGSGPCPDSLYSDALTRFNSLDAPAIFTPGDNDWTDCDRDPAYSSLERLDQERLVFFSTPYTLGGHPFLQEVQSSPLCLGVGGPTPCVENRRWTAGRVMYATLNVQGSCNNLCDVAPDPSEFAARNAANIAWMQGTFAAAKADGSAAVMFISQADPAFDRTTGISDYTRSPTTLDQDLTPTAPVDGYKAFLTALRNEVIAFRRPVAYVHGDSHYFRVDKPFLSATGFRLENFTRVGTFGSHAAQGNNDVQWVKVYVDPNSREVFAYQVQIVPGNRTAVPPL